MWFQNSSCSKWRLVFLYSIFFKIDKNLRIFLLHSFFVLPCCVFSTVAGPWYLYQTYGFIPKHFEFSVLDAYWFHPEIPFVFHLDHSPINYVVRVTHISLIMTHEIHYALSWMQAMIACMQLALSSLRFQKVYNILLPTLGSYRILVNFSSL
jgi:hypothetical protein